MDIKVIDSTAALGGTLNPSVQQDTIYHVKLDSDLTITDPTVNGDAILPRGVGARVTFVFVQDATGGRKVNFPGTKFLDTAVFIPRQGHDQRSGLGFVQHSDGTWSRVGLDGIDLSKPLHPHDFGAKGDNVTDDWAALQAMLNVAATHSGFNPDVSTVGYDIGVGTYLASRPLTLTPNNQVSQSIFGRGVEATVIKGYGAMYGPVLWVGPSYSAQALMHTGVAAVGPGVSWHLQQQTHFLNFSQIPNSETNGQAQLTKRCWINPDSVSAGTADYVTSPFGAQLHGTAISGMTIYVTGIGAPGGQYCVVAILTTTAGTYTISSASSSAFYTAGSWEYVSAEYDGSDFALYVGPKAGTATRVAHVAASGNVKRAHYHEECLGMFSPKFPQSNGSFNTMIGYIDSFEILNTRVHSSGTTSFSAPIAKHTASGNTLILVNFETFDRNFVVGTTSSGSPAYLPLYVCGLALNQRNGIHVRNLTVQSFYGGGIYLNAVLDSTFEDLKIISYCPWFGFDNSYDITVRNIVISCGTASPSWVAPYAMGFANTFGGISVFQHIWITGGKTALAHGGGFSGQWTQLFYQPDVNIVVGLFFGGEPNSTAVFTQFGVDGEGNWPNYELGAYVFGGSMLTFKDSYLEWLGDHTIDAPTFQLTDVSSLVLEDSMLTHFDGIDTKIFDFTAAPNPHLAPETIVLRNTKQVNVTKIPWATAANLYRLTIDGAQRSAVADAAYVALQTDRVIAYTSLTLPRQVTLVDPSTVPNGWQVLVADEAGTAGSHTITVKDALGATVGTITTNGGVLRAYSTGAAWKAG